jgi:hypothetical protein
VNFTVYTIEVALAHVRELQERTDRARLSRAAARQRVKSRFPRAKKR